MGITRNCRRHHKKHWQSKHLENGVFITVCRLCGREINRTSEKLRENMEKRSTRAIRAEDDGVPYDDGE